MDPLIKHGRHAANSRQHERRHRLRLSTNPLALALCSSLILLHLPSLAAAQSTSPISSVPADANTGTDAELQIALGWHRSDSIRYRISALIPNYQSRQPPSYGGSAKQILPNNTADVTTDTFAFISCDSSSYDNSSAIDTIAQSISRNTAATILYSNVQAGCNYLPGGPINPNYNRVYTLTASQGNGTLFQYINDNTSMVWLAQKRVLDSNSTSTPSTSPGSTNNGPSPSTAVAMIILYSITGVITALFLIIIVTGAVRAHRHPERYGPRNALGRPRQSRARGLARAMLETLPIVKFGERDESKPNDVELAGTTTTEAKNARNSTLTEAEGEKTSNEDRSNEISANGEQSTTQAEDLTAAAAVPKPDEALGCSICTDDFEIGQDVRVLPCDHHFHPACIDPWLLNVSGTCPLCRIDLRPAPVTDEAGNSISDAEAFPPPLDASEQARRASRRHSLIWDILNPNRMREAGPQERLAALRRVRQERGMSQTEEVEARRRRRLTARLQDVFHIRTAPNATSEAEAAAESAGAANANHRVSTIGRIAEVPGETDTNEITASPTSLVSPVTSDWPTARSKSNGEIDAPSTSQQHQKISDANAASTSDNKSSTSST